MRCRDGRHPVAWWPLRCRCKGTVTTAYRPELDGIRGIAILLVLASHVHVPWMAGGGMVGVTLFFVLSGYLITGLLRDEVERTGKVDLRAFYVRRIRRLLPALVALLAVVLALGLATPLQAGLALLYVGNLWQAVGGDLGTLAATWSLSVEEQFYLVWPALFILGRGSRWLVYALAMGIAVSVLSRLTVIGSDLAPNRTDIRMDAILWGCVLAFVPLRLPIWPAVVALAFVVILQPDAYMIGFTLAALGSLAIVSQARPGVLSSRFLVRTGQLSYGLYLWHMPVTWVLVRPVFEPATALAVIVVTFTAALISERWIERPFRDVRARVVIEPHQREVVGSWGRGQVARDDDRQVLVTPLDRGEVECRGASVVAH